MLSKPTQAQHHNSSLIEKIILKDRRSSHQWLEYILLLVIIAGTLGLRLSGLNRTSIWFDESFNVVLSHELSFFDNLTLHQYFIIHPPLFFVVLHLWTSLGGRR